MRKKSIFEQFRFLTNISSYEKKSIFEQFRFLTNISSLEKKNRFLTNISTFEKKNYYSIIDFWPRKTWLINYDLNKSREFVQSEYNGFLKSFHQSDIDAILSAEDSLRVAVVRHPISRFVSAWAQKFRTKGEFDQHREEWLKKWPKLDGYLSVGVRATHRIRFSKFLEFFETCTTPAKFNPHWSLASEA